MNIVVWDGACGQPPGRG